jgi:threonine/homoserine/homoserine lactone efflux protein
VDLGIHDYGVFVASALLLNLTPGQDSLYILGRTMAQGRRIGVAAALGISAGTAVHCLAAALGLSAVFAASTLLFDLLRIAGAAYLIHLGIQMLRAGPTARNRATMQGQSVAAAFRQGVITNVANPKVALFFLAFLPQFVAPQSTHRLLALLVLGATFVVTSTAWCLLLALGAGRLRRAAAPNRDVGRLLSGAAGGLFIVLGSRLALSEQ